MRYLAEVRENMEEIGRPVNLVPSCRDISQLSGSSPSTRKGPLYFYPADPSQRWLCHRMPAENRKRKGRRGAKQQNRKRGRIRSQQRDHELLQRESVDVKAVRIVT